MRSRTATVVATFSRRMRVRLDDSMEVDARIKGRKLRPVCGDQVVVEYLDGEDDWMISGINDRRNTLTRPNKRGEPEVLAANFDRLLVAAAPEPKPDWFIVDRYLCAAENAGARPAVIFNKADLEYAKEFDAELDVYRAIGYDVLLCSAEHGDGAEKVGALIQQATALIVGQSGVGKSSLINRLLGNEQQRIAEISGKTGEGKHTTVNSAMYAVGNSGYVIDSPGVRDFAPALASEREVEAGFREIHEKAADCRFANCRHLREPGCAVIENVESGSIDARRYESYRRSVRLTERLNKKRF